MEALFSSVLALSLAGSAATIVVLLGRLLLRKAPRIFSYVLWAVVLFRLLCPLGIPVTYPQPIAPSVETQAPAFPIPSLAEVPASQAPAQPAPQAPGPEAPVKAPIFSWMALLSRLWLLGALGFLAYGILSYLRFHRRLCASVRIRGNLYEADHLPSAFVSGFLQPRIYLPSGLSPRELPYIAAHERCHIRRLDHITRPLAYVALSIHWFNPLVWLAFRLSGLDMELSCDEAVLNRLGGSIRADYAQSLLSLARKKPIPGVPLAFGACSTKVRIQNMETWKKSKKSVTILCTLAALLVLTLCACKPQAETIPPESTSGAETAVTEGPELSILHGEYPLGESLILRDGTVYKADTPAGKLFPLAITAEELSLKPDVPTMEQWYDLLKEGMPGIQPGAYDFFGGSAIDYLAEYSFFHPEVGEFSHSVFESQGQCYSLSLDHSRLSVQERTAITSGVAQLAGLREHESQVPETASAPYNLPEGLSFREETKKGCTVYSGEAPVGSIFLLDLTMEEVQRMTDDMDLDQWYEHLKPGMPDIAPDQYDCMSGGDMYYNLTLSYANREKEYVHYVFSVEGQETRKQNSYSLSLDRSKISSKQEGILVDAVTQLAGLNTGAEPEPTVSYPPLEFKNVTDHSADIYDQDGLCGGIVLLDITPEELAARDEKKLEAAVKAVSQELDPRPFVDYASPEVPSYADYEATYVTEQGFTEHYVFTKDGQCYDLWFETLSVWLDSKFEAVELVLAS